MNIDYNAAIEILKSFLENEKTEILGISVGEERQVKDAIRNLLTAYEKEKEKNKEYNMGIKNLISQIESAIDFMKTNKSKIKVDMYKQKEEDLKLEIVHLKKLLKEE